MLEKENAFYLAHQTEFHEKYLDKWLVIYGEELFGAFDTIKEAIEAALPRFGDKDFLLHRPADDGTVIEIGPIITDGQEDDGVMTVVGEGRKVFTYA